MSSSVSQLRETDSQNQKEIEESNEEKTLKATCPKQRGKHKRCTSQSLKQKKLRCKKSWKESKEGVPQTNNACVPVVASQKRETMLAKDAVVALAKWGGTPGGARTKEKRIRREFIQVSF